jgi:hypothetical protein
VGGLCVRRDFMGGYAKGAETFWAPLYD